jgi:histidyl-tRNA synthetase
LIDAECIAMLHNYLCSIGIKDATFIINTRGVAEDRAPAEKLLREYFAKHLDKMCPDCRTRFERNIWRILDCKQEECGKIIADAPDYVESFTDASKAYFAEVKAALDLLNVPYKVNSRLVRGLDYYVHTVFEVVHSGLGEQIAIAGGGRYELFLPGEKRPLPGVGFATGCERLLLVREALQLPPPESPQTSVYLIGLGAPARLANMGVAASLRQQGLRVEMELEERSFKAQMRGANRSGAKFAVLRGDNELASGIAIVKNMADGSQVEVNEAELTDFIVKSI